MQKLTQKYTIIYLFDVLPAGSEYSMKAWPLHVTLADVFAIEGNPDDLLVDLGELANSSRSFESSVTGEDWFGESSAGVHVMLIKKTDELQQLHESVLQVLEKYNVKFNNPAYIHDGFVPHSTVQNDSGLELGSSINFDSITLIDMFPNDNPYNRRVLGTVQFRE